MAIAERARKLPGKRSLVPGPGPGHQWRLGEVARDLGVPHRSPGWVDQPEELAAATHSACFAMALALRLGNTPSGPERLTITATVSLDEVDGMSTIVSRRFGYVVACRARIRRASRRRCMRPPRCARCPTCSLGHRPRCTPNSTRPDAQSGRGVG